MHSTSSALALPCVDRIQSLSSSNTLELWNWRGRALTKRTGWDGLTVRPPGTGQ
jgi:hypothetical protein